MSVPLGEDRDGSPRYRRLMNHVRPDVLLGLTATPERTDQLDVFAWFGGEASAEIRLPDAINRRLLCPFQYFGVADCVDLDAFCCIICKARSIGAA